MEVFCIVLSFISCIFSYLILYLYKRFMKIKCYITIFVLLCIFNLIYFFICKNLLFLILINLMIPLFVVICYFDYKEMIIPDAMLIILFIYFIILKILKINFLNITFNKILIGGIILIIVMAIHLILMKFKVELIGFGDLKLLFILNLILGIDLIIVVLFISSLIACLFEVIILKRKLFPFGPYIIIGFILILFFYEILI